MGKDYYSILQITRSANDAQIKQAYRKLALNFHPIKNPGVKSIEDKFKECAEAYDILSDSAKKALYDQYGEEGLKAGIPSSNETWSEPYKFHGNAYRVFHEFFGGDNPFSEFYENAQKDKENNFGGIDGRGRKRQDPPIEKFLMLSLEECYHGCIKKMKIERRVMNDDGHTSSCKEKILTITVKRGWKPGTTITFEKEGDQGPNTIPADIVFIVKDKPHPIFCRENTDLIYKHNIPLGLALVGTTIHVPTLDGRLLDIPITDIVRPGYTKVIQNEGMPFADDPNKKGNLIIEFEIEFPRALSLESKDFIRHALPLNPAQTLRQDIIKKKGGTLKKEKNKTKTGNDDDFYED